MKILIIGGEGQLGNSLTKLSKNESFAQFQTTTIDQLDLSKEENIEIFFEKQSFDYVVNCTAYTAVDKAENDQVTARLINAKAIQWIGRYAKLKGAGVIHISTDYVFSGESNLPLTTKDIVNPNSVYGITKAEGEQLLMQENKNSIIIRTSWLYSEYGSNFLKTMLKLGAEKEEIKVVFDQIGTPTYASDLASAILHILKTVALDSTHFVPDVYHYSNEGVCSWYDFAQMIFKLAKLKCKIEAVRSDLFPTIAKRPAYSVMDKAKIKKQFNIAIPFWVDSLEKCLKEMNELK
ncbi:MAG TPA: dTDP-4-dehydrorhamnose reductase [Marinilabiliaceae bacterium]|nr:dTDP-4-dehydrorhamnose reductase [Marinilabiliaceae bacterium]